MLVNEVYSTFTNIGSFNFSGGTIQPISLSGASAGGASGDFIGNPTPNMNFTMPISGNAATFDTTDITGSAETVTNYATLTGNGSLTTIGTGTLVFAATDSANYNYSGQVNVNSGTVHQIGAGKHLRRCSPAAT